MLQNKTIESGTFSLLIDLMEIDELNSFSLVGGTALALKFGHRISVDIDLFTNQRFDVLNLVSVLESRFGSDFSYLHQHNTSCIFCYIRDVKVDIVYYPHRLISPIVTTQKIRMYDDPDIAAMKIQAILGRGKKKDFWDLNQLFKNYTLGQIIDWHKQKFPNQMLAISIPHALTYFVDADESENPHCLNGYKWEEVKTAIKKVVRDFLS